MGDSSWQEDGSWHGQDSGWQKSGWHEAPPPVAAAPDAVPKAAVAAPTAEADSPGATKARLKRTEAELEEARQVIIALQHEVRMLDEQLAWEKHSGLQLGRELELEREKVRGFVNWARDIEEMVDAAPHRDVI